jgi:hypothetical protein
LRSENFFLYDLVASAVVIIHAGCTTDNLKLAGPSKVLTSRQFISAKMLIDFHDDKRLDAAETIKGACVRERGTR